MSTSIISLPNSNHAELLDTLAQEFKAGFQQLSESAEQELTGRRFVFSRYGKELYPYFEAAEGSPIPGCISPIKEGRWVASVDSTCVLMGETSQGALYAARTAVGLSYEGSLRRFFRLGPILVYASTTGLTGLGSDVTSAELDLILADHAVAERVIRNTVERRVLEALLSSDAETIVMADGSLKHPLGQLSGAALRMAAARNSLVGFSKSSNLIFSEGAVSALTTADRPSYYTVDDGPVKTVLAKFTAGGLVFRLDLAGSEPAQKTLGRIMWNDAFASGYPDSLKVAHHLSIFSKAEDQALKALVTKRFRVRQLPTFPLRKIALGSFRGSA